MSFSESKKSENEKPKFVSFLTFFVTVSIFFYGISHAAVCDIITDVPKSECEVLVDLYNATDGDNWTDKSGWMAGTEVGSWSGILVQGGHVTEIDLDSNNLTGTIPASVANLPNLRRLNLSSNNLTGSIPIEIGALANLEWLELYRNTLSGNIPPELGSLTKLQRLWLYRNQLDGELPSEIGNLTALDSIYIYNNTGLSGCLPDSLRNLTLSGFQFQSTGLQEPQDTDFQNWLGGIASLQGTGVPCATSICDSVTDVPKSECAALVALYNATDGDNWTDKTGWMTGTQVGNWFGVTVQGGHVTKIELGSNNLVGTIPSEIGNFPNLVDLYLGNNQLNGSIPVEIGNLSNLQYLYLDRNPLTGTIPSEIGSLSSLITLSLYSTQLSGNVPNEVGNLSSLLSLYLQNTSLNGCLPDELMNLSLTFFYFQNTSLREPQDAAFQAWLAGITVNGTGVPCTFCDSVSDVPVSECEALVALYNATDGDNWYYNGYQWFDIDGWLVSTEVGDWHGVTVQGGHVTEIDLSSNNLIGFIPPELAELNELQYLDLTFNELNGKIPPELGRLSSLEYLSLRDNQLTGGIPPELGDLNNLQELRINQNPLSGEIPPELGNLSNLINLELGSNQLRGEIPPELGNLSNLITLSLNNNQLSGEIPPELGNLINLGRLFLENNQLNGCMATELTNLPLNLFWFDDTTLREPQDADFQNWLTGISNLWRTYSPCTACDTVTDIPPNECEALTALYNATTGDNWVNKDGWLTDPLAANWHGITVSGGHVTEIKLKGNRLDGTIPSEIGNLNHLTLLYLPSNRLTGSIPSTIGNLTELLNINIAGNSLTGIIPSEIGELKKLEGLYLPRNFLEGPLPASMGSLASLKILQLNSNRITGSIPPEFGNLPAVETLWLYHNLLSGTLPPELGQLSTLINFKVYDNQLTGTIPTTFGSLSSLKWLSVSDNPMSGCLPQSLANLDLGYFWYNNTKLTEPRSETFMTAITPWQYGATEATSNIKHLGRTGVACGDEFDDPPVSSDGLVLHYTFDEPLLNPLSANLVKDRSGRGNDGYVFNYEKYYEGRDDGVFWGVVSGVSGNALDLTDGKNYVTIPDNGDLSFEDNMTVSVWVKLNDVNKIANIVCKASDPEYDEINYWMSYTGDQDSDALDNLFTLGRESLESDVNPSVKSLAKNQPGQWYNVTGVFDGTQMHIYVDGALERSRNAEFTAYTGPMDLVLGTNFFTDYYTGRTADNGKVRWSDIAIDELRIYNRALSQAEIDALQTVSPDADSDGMDDVWERQYFGDYTHDGTADTDGDGQSDLQEFTDGTSPVVAQVVESIPQTSKVFASDGDADDLFGYYVNATAMDGDYAVVGMPEFDSAAENGAAYVYERNGNAWNQVAKLTATDGQPGDNFGYSVDISENTIIVGSFYHETPHDGRSGAGYIFVKPAGGWQDMTETAKLTYTGASSPEPLNNAFGWSVAVSSDYALISARNDVGVQYASGAVYVYEKPGGGWADMTETVMLKAGVPQPWANFGEDVDTEGDIIIIGAPGYADFGDASGAAYVFKREAGAWKQKQRLTPTDPQYQDHFGQSVAISGDTIIVGADHQPDGRGDQTGAAYIFEPSGGMWFQTAKLLPSDPAIADFFANQVSISDQYVVIGAHNDDVNGSDSGSVYIFQKSSSGWSDMTETKKFTAKDGQAGDHLGWSVAHSGDYFIASAPHDDDKDSNAGAAYIHSLVDMETGLIAYYPFDGNANDASGNGLHGTVEGAEEIDGFYNTALDFRKTTAPNSRVYLNENLSDLVSGDFSINMWVNLQSEKDFNYIFHSDDDQPGIRLTSSSQVGFMFKSSSDLEPLPGESSAVVSAESLPINQWVMLTLQWDGMFFSGYINGELVAQKNLPFFNLGGMIHIGRDTSPERNFEGYIDEVRIYNRALTDVEVTKLAQPRPEEIESVVHFPLDGSAEDASGNGHGGTLEGPREVKGIYGSALDFTTPYTAPTPVTDGNSYWGMSILRLEVEIIGGKAEFTLTKQDGTPFNQDSDAYLKNGTYTESGGEVPGGFHRILATDNISSVVFTDDLNQYASGSWPQEYYVRLNNDPGGWSWVGPVTVSKPATPNTGLFLDVKMSDLVVDDFTVNMWINVQTAKSENYIFHSVDDMPGIRLTSDNRIEFAFKADSGSEPLAGEPSVIASAEPLPMDQWTMVTLKWDGDVFSGYVNGALAAEKNLPFFNPGGTIHIGSDGNSDHNFEGFIDDVRIYDQVLTDREIEKLLDTDDDNMPDGWEEDNFDDLTHNNTHDTDRDGMTDDQEFKYGKNPNVRDEPDYKDDSYRRSFSPDDLPKISYDAEIIYNSDGTHQIRIKDIWSDDSTTGGPILPVQIPQIFMPPDHKLVAVKIIYREFEFLDGEYHVDYAREMGNMPGDGDDSSDSGLDPDIYNSDIYYFQKLDPDVVKDAVANKTLVTYTDGRKQRLHGITVVNADVQPVLFNPVEGKIAAASKVEVILLTNPPETGQVSENDDSTRIIFDNSDDHAEMVEKTVDNGEMFSTFRESLPPYEAPAESWQYLVITTEELEPVFKELIEHRTSPEGGGYTAKIKTIEEIEEEYAGKGRDRAERMRSFIKNAYQHHETKFVVLGGDCDGPPDRIDENGEFVKSTHAIPTRECRIEEVIGGGDRVKEKIQSQAAVSDMYFGCLDGTWNVDEKLKCVVHFEDNDGIKQLDIDWYSEVYVGRIAADNPDEAKHHIHKIITFEKDNSPARALMIGGYLDPNYTGEDKLDSIINSGLQKYAEEYYERYYLNEHCAGQGLTGEDLSECLQNPEAEEVLKYINKNIFHMIDHCGHGYFEKNIGITRNNLTEMTNNNYFFHYSQSCFSGSIDGVEKKSENEEQAEPVYRMDIDCIAEDMTNLQENGGAFASIANSRVGKIGQEIDGGSNRHNKAFMKKLMNGVSWIGMANQNAKIDILIKDAWEYKWIALETNLIGDPATSFLLKPYAQISGEIFFGEGEDSSNENKKPATASDVIMAVEKKEGDAYPATAVGDGEYTIKVPVGWTGSVVLKTPDGEKKFKSVEFKEPVMVDIINQDIDLQLETDPEMFSISGQILDYKQNNVEGVELTGFPDPIFTDVSGKYAVQVPQGWSGTVKPQKGDLYFITKDKVYSSVDTPYPDQDYVAYSMPLDQIGVFIATQTEVKIAFMYDGGGYEGELGIFSLEGMDDLEKGSEAFIKEAIRRVLSDDKSEGCIVIQDAVEGARFEGTLGTSNESNQNKGPYKGSKTLTMTVGHRFATIMIPDSTFETVNKDLETQSLENLMGNPKKFPLLSLASEAEEHPILRYGQMAIVRGIGVEDEEECKGAGYSVVYEDILVSSSNDGDYNDMIIHVRGAEVFAPTFDALIDIDKMSEDKDWRNTEELGVMSHLSVCPAPDDPWVKVTLEANADLLVYTPDGGVIGKDGGTIPGTRFEWDENNRQVVTLSGLEYSNYRIVVRAIDDGLCRLEVTGYQSGEFLDLYEQTQSIQAHEVLTTTFSASEMVKTGSVTFDPLAVPKAPDGEPLPFDFDGDNDIDKDDIDKVVKRWNLCEGNSEYDLFYDLNDNGCIDFYDVMSVMNKFYVMP